MTSVADLYAAAIIRMDTREVAVVLIEPPTPPALDLTGATFAGKNTIAQVTSLAGYNPNAKSGAGRRMFWQMECLRCGYSFQKPQGRILEGSLRCATCFDASITERPTLAEAMAAYEIRQRLGLKAA